MKEVFEEKLKAHCHRLLESTPQKLAQSIQYSLFLPGKRIRPRLVSAVSEVLGLNQEAALRTALALEMVHCFSLIHDDLPCMDNDDFRRGKPSNHKAFDEATALLAGDSLLSLAFEVLLEAHEFVSKENHIQGMKRFAKSVGPIGMMGGQAAEFENSARNSLEGVFEIHRKKTGALFQASILIPADFFGLKADSKEAQTLLGFSEAVGLGFQIADDLEDAEQDEKEAVSVLKWLSPQKAADLGASKLAEVKENLITTFGIDRSRELCKITDEILERLKPT